ncbi:MAG: 50S ribosomal protein L17 [Cyclobacteriaceae bacterium]
MRHGKKFNHLGRTASHREAMLSNMASSLIKYKRINTTVAKAKALRKYIEPIITKAKSDTTHSRRMVFSYLQDKESVQELFGSVAEKVANRPGGYTRIIKMGNRLGDNADMCMMELVDYNELLLQETTAKKSRRSRRGGKKSETAKVEAAPVEEVVAEEVAPVEVVEEASIETSEEVPEVSAEEESGTGESTEDDNKEEK